MGLFNKNKDSKNGQILPPPPVSAVTPAPAMPPIQQEMPPVSPTMDDGFNPGKLIPPSPLGSLEDIKNEVSSVKSLVSKPEENSVSVSDSKSEDMFDLSDLDLGEFSGESLPELSESDVSSVVPSSRSLSFRDSSQNSLPVSKGDFFIPTAKFKVMLETIDSVKKKVKDSLDTHSKIVDAKIQEDLEFEVLKKQFQFIEDKLSDIDSLIFER